MTDRDSCGTALRRLARFRDPVAIIAARMRLAFSAKHNSPNLVHSRFPKSSRYFCQSPERYRGAVLSGRKPSGRLQLTHLSGFVLGGRRDTGIALGTVFLSQSARWNGSERCASAHSSCVAPPMNMFSVLARSRGRYTPCIPPRGIERPLTPPVDRFR